MKPLVASELEAKERSEIHMKYLEQQKELRELQRARHFVHNKLNADELRDTKKA